MEEEQARFPKGVNDDVLDAEAYQNQIAEMSIKDDTYKQDPHQPQSEYEGGDNTPKTNPVMPNKDELGVM